MTSSDIRASPQRDPNKKFQFYKTFCNLRKYKGCIVNFDYPAIYTIDYNALILAPSIIVTSVKDAEDIKNAPIPKIFFYFIYKHSLTNRCSFSDGSKNDPGNHVGNSIYSPSIHLQLLYRIGSHASIFTAETLAILHSLKYILTHSISKSVIFTDSKGVTEALSSLNLCHSHKFANFENNCLDTSIHRHSWKQNRGEPSPR